MSDVENRLATLERQVRNLRIQAQAHEEWLDTVNSPIWKRIWWWMQGYKFYRVGRWYDSTTIPNLRNKRASGEDTHSR